MQIFLDTLPGRFTVFTHSKEQGQGSWAPGLRQGGFIYLHQGMITCKPGSGTVPTYGQKMSPWEGTLEWVARTEKATGDNL